MSITFKETACKCGCGLNITPKFHFILNQIRLEYGKPIVVLSGARCPEHNAKIGGAKKSSHIEGLAVDLMRSSSLRAFLIANVEKFDIYLEDPSHTGNDDAGWLHCQLRPTASGKRVFLP